MRSAPPAAALTAARRARGPPEPCALPPVQVNDWQKDWVAFYAQQRLQPQMDMLEKGSGDREALELWSALQVSGAGRPAGRCGLGLARACGHRCALCFARPWEPPSLPPCQRPR